MDKMDKQEAIDELINELLKEKFNIIIEEYECGFCGGEGKIMEEDPSEEYPYIDYCPKCYGRGKIKNKNYVKKDKGYKDMNISLTIDGKKIAKAIKLNEDLNLKI